MGRLRQILAARINAGSKGNLYFLYMHVANSYLLVCLLLQNIFKV